MASIKEENIVSRIQQIGDAQALFRTIEGILDGFDNGVQYRLTMILETIYNSSRRMTHSSLIIDNYWRL